MLELDLVFNTIAARADQADQGIINLSADMQELHHAGLIAAVLPKEYGGKGLGYEPYGIKQAYHVLCSLGCANLAVARVYEGHMNAVKLLALYGNEAQKQRIFSEVSQGKLLGVWGANAASPTRMETLPNGKRRLQGAKRFASGLGLIDFAIITVNMPENNGTQLVIVPVDEKSRMDKSVWNTTGMRTTDSGNYDFCDVEITADQLVGRLNDYSREPHFEGGIWRYCAAHVGAIKALAIALREHLSTTGQDKNPHQMKRYAELLLAYETARLWSEKAAHRVEASLAGASAVAYTLLAREQVERSCLEALHIIDRAFGTASFFENHPVERIRRDLSFYLRQAALDAKLEHGAHHFLVEDLLWEP